MFNRPKCVNILQVLEIPLTEINMNGRDREVKLNRLKINSNFITASFDVHPEICVWDAKSHELVSTFYVGVTQC